LSSSDLHSREISPFFSSSSFRAYAKALKVGNDPGGGVGPRGIGVWAMLPGAKADGDPDEIPMASETSANTAGLIDFSPAAWGELTFSDESDEEQEPSLIPDQLESELSTGMRSNSLYTLMLRCPRAIAGTC
jgi:hypothetical protein